MFSVEKNYFNLYLNLLMGIRIFFVGYYKFFQSDILGL